MINECGECDLMMFYRQRKIMRLVKKDVVTESFLKEFVSSSVKVSAAYGELNRLRDRIDQKKNKLPS